MEEEYYDQLGRYGNDLKEDYGTDCQSGDQEVLMKEKKKRAQRANDKCSHNKGLSSHIANGPYQQIINPIQSMHGVESQKTVQGIEENNHSKKNKCRRAVAVYVISSRTVLCSSCPMTPPAPKGVSADHWRRTLSSIFLAAFLHGTFPGPLGLKISAESASFITSEE